MNQNKSGKTLYGTWLRADIKKKLFMTKRTWHS